MTAQCNYGIYEMPWSTSDDGYILRYAIQQGINEYGLPKFQVALRTTFDPRPDAPNVAEIDCRTGTIRRFRIGPGEKL